MYILKNAVKNILRNKGRNVLIMIITLVIALSACIALSIRQASENSKEETLSNMKITAGISIDRKAMMEKSMNESSGNDRMDMKEMLQNSDELSLDEMKKYADLSSVEDFYYSMSSSLNGAKDLEAVSTNAGSDSISNESENTQNNENPFQKDNFQNNEKPGKMGMGTEGDFTLIGYSGEEAMTDFIGGTCKLTDGEMFTQNSSNKECIISDELATLNSVKVGDKITLANPNDEEETVKFTVTGIYTNSESGTQLPGTMNFGSANDPANQILTSYKALKTIIDSSESNATTGTDSNTGMETSTALRSQTVGTYTFADIDSYETFTKEVYEEGLSEDYTVSSQDLTSYENSLRPLENLSKFATYFLVIVLIIGAVILVILNIYNIRNRKYEIGVLTAIGMKKYKVALQFLTETFIITFTAIIIGAVIGACTSVPITNTLLQSQIEASQSSAQQIEENFGRGGSLENSPAPEDKNEDANNNSPEDRGGFMNKMMEDTSQYISSVNSATDLGVILELVLIGLALTLISGIASIVFVMRYEPLKILTQRD